MTGPSGPWSNVKIKNIEVYLDSKSTHGKQVFKVVDECGGTTFVTFDEE